MYRIFYILDSVVKEEVFFFVVEIALQKEKGIDVVCGASFDFVRLVELQEVSVARRVWTIIKPASSSR